MTTSEQPRTWSKRRSAISAGSRPDERRRLLGRWADYVLAIVTDKRPPARVVQLRK
jgi:hypothetical protein